MANDIKLIEKFIPKLDTVYQQNARTAILDAAPEMVRETEDANVVKVAKMDFDGLGNYSRTDGYPTGAITLDWETWTFKNDRGKRFNLDKMDNVETAGVAFFGVSGEFLRTKVIPEKDAYTIAYIAGHDGVEKVSEAIDATNAKESLEKATVYTANNEVDEANLVLFCSPNFKGALEAQLNRTLPSGVTSYGQKINYFNDIPLIVVPPRRFYSAISLQDGTSTGEEKGGYKKAEGANDLNYILMDRTAAMTIQKNAVMQVIPPELNQLYNGWTFNYRFYYDTFMYENRVPGVYVSQTAVQP